MRVDARARKVTVSEEKPTVSSRPISKAELRERTEAQHAPLVVCSAVRV